MTIVTLTKSTYPHQSFTVQQATAEHFYFKIKNERRRWEKLTCGIVTYTYLVITVFVRTIINANITVKFWENYLQQACKLVTCSEWVAPT